MPVPLCPHCHVVIGDDSMWPYPLRAMPCPNCRLIIGVCRARADDGTGAARARGSAAGVMANEARRANREPGDPAAVGEALARVAAALGVPTDRMRMVDYQDAAAEDVTLPELATVLATFDTWKRARLAAADQDSLPEPA